MSVLRQLGRPPILGATLLLWLAAACSGTTVGTDHTPQEPGGTDHTPSEPGEPEHVPCEPLETISGYGLFVIDLDDCGVTVLLDEYQFSGFDLSPDGTRMAHSGHNYHHHEDPPVDPPRSRYSGLIVAASDGSDPVLLTEEWIGRRVWSPDGSRLLYSNQDGLFAVSMDDYSHTKLSDNQVGRIVFLEGGNILHAGPDGLFVSAIDGSLDRRLVESTPDGHSLDWEVNGVAQTHVAIKTGKDLMLAAIDNDGSEPRRLTASTDPYMRNEWSPDGTKLAFGFGSLLYVADLDGNGLHAIGTGVYQGSVAYHVWSPDSARVAYVVGGDEYEWANSLYVSDLSSDEPLLLSGQGRVESASWSPDSSRIAYAVSGHIHDDHVRLWVSKSDGSDQRVVAAVPNEHYTYYTVHDPFYRWFPDSGQLAYLTSFDEDQRAGELMGFDPDAGTSRLLAGGWNGYLEWSDRGDRLIYRSTDGLFLADADGGNPTRIGTPDARVVNWSPDGAWFTLNDAGGAFVVDAETRAGEQFNAQEVGYRFWSHDSSRLVYATDEGIYVYDAQTGNSRKLVSVSQDFSVIVPHWIPDGSGIIVTVTFIDYE